MPLPIVNQPTQEDTSKDDFLETAPPVSTGVFLAAVGAGELDNVRAYLERQPELVRSRDAVGSSPLMVAILHEQDEVIDLLLRTEGIDVTFCAAAALGDLERLRRLLSADPTVHTQTSADGSTALGLACFFGRLEAVDLLLEAGAGVHQVSDDLQRTTALHRAVAQRDPQLARSLSERLLRAEAPVDALQAGGFTPLHQAASRGLEDLVQLLLEHGADPTVESDQGWTAADLAGRRGHRLAALS